MAVKNKKKDVKKKNDKKKNERVLKNPSKTIWGRVLIWILAVAMVAGTVGTLIYLIVDNFTKV